MLAEAAQEQGWSFVGPVTVRFEEVDELGTGAFRVRSAVLAGEVAVPAAPIAPTDRTAPPHLEHGGRTVPITARTVVGRGAEADLQLVDTGVSRRHAELRIVKASAGDSHDDRVELHDLGSTNGTRVNGQRITAVTLTDGDSITIGTSQLVFRSGR